MEDVLPKITDHACAFIEKAAKTKAPFFAYVPLNGPHTPWVPSKAFQGKSKAGLYGDFVEEIDYSIGRIMDQLKASGADRDTLLIVTSDNGAPWAKVDSEAAIGHWANTPWRGQKADIQEAGHRIPFLVRWPGRVKAGSVSSQLVCLTDLFSTVAEVVEQPLSKEMGEDSMSILPVLLGKGKGAREGIVHHSRSRPVLHPRRRLETGGGARFRRLHKPVKITPGPGEPEGELYNLREDPHEDRNLYQERPKEVARLQAVLDGWRKRGSSRQGV